MTCNTGVLVGTIVTDLESKQINDNLFVVSFRVAPCNAREEDSPIPVVAYNDQAKRLIARQNKGDTMSFSYRLRYKTWMTPEGEPRGRMEVIVFSSDTIRLGQISTAQRAEQAAHQRQQAQEEHPAAAIKRTPVKRRAPEPEPTLDEVPF